MRVATAAAFDRSIDAMQQRRAELTRTQAQLSSGKRIDKLSDDPSGAADAERARAANARIDATQRMIDYAKLMLGQAESTVATATDEMQSVREALLQAKNATLGSSDRALIAKQLRGSYDSLLAIANRADGAGGYVFGGAGGQSAPFVQGASVTYTAQAPEQTVATDPALALSQNGADAFVNLPAPGGAGGQQSLFTTLSNAITLLEDPTATSAAVQSGLKDALDGVDAGLSRLEVKRAQIGESLAIVDKQTNLNEANATDLKARVSDLVDLDFAKAITELNTNQTALEAAMKTYTQVSRMSLFEYL